MNVCRRYFKTSCYPAFVCIYVYLVAAKKFAALYRPSYVVEDVYAWQKMNIYVHDGTAEDQDTAIILQIQNTFWMNGPVSEAMKPGDKFVSNTDSDNTGAALKAGYITCRAGMRSRRLIAADGTYPGYVPVVVYL